MAEILKQQLNGVNIYLIGMMGAGKSTVGQDLSRKLGYKFLDTDDLIKKVAGQSISDIFAKEGEEKFRDLESQVLSQICAYKQLVIATGGGIVLRSMNWSYLRHGIIIWLNVPVEALYQRLKGDTTRPLLQHPDPLGQLQNILEQRQTLYGQGDLEIQVNINDQSEEVAAKIIEKIPSILKPQIKAMN